MTLAQVAAVLGGGGGIQRDDSQTGAMLCRLRMGQATAAELAAVAGCDTQGVYPRLARRVKAGQVIRTGNARKAVYSLPTAIND